MSFIAVGTNHKYSPIALREKLSFSKKRLKDALLLLNERGLFKGAVILSTCNRVEIYASTEDTKKEIREIEYFLSRYHEIDKQKLSSYLYKYEGKEALKHLFSVTCGLDSLILGETQILGQVKSAFSEAENAGFIDEFLSKIFHSAIAFAKNVHQYTKISEGKVSVGSIAIDFIKERIGNLAGNNILIIGAGKVTGLALKYLEKDDLNVVFISNRTFDRAKDLAVRINAKAVRFDDLKLYLKKANVVISATASPHFIIKKETLEEITSHKILIIDLALPRDIDPRVKELSNIDLFCLEDLDAVIKKNIESKVQEARKVKGIIDIEVGKQWREFTKLEREAVLWP